MTGPEHYLQADRLVAEATQADPDADRADIALLLTFAQAHLAAAHVAVMADAFTAPLDTYRGSAWAKAVSR